VTDDPDDLTHLPPLERAREAARLTERHRGLVGYYASIRAQAIDEAAQTMSQNDIAAALGVSKKAISKIRRGLAASGH